MPAYLQLPIGDGGQVRRKVLQDYANKVCEIFVGWRLAVSSSDIPALIAAGKGEIEIDLLSGVATLDGEVVDRLGIAGELQAWLANRIEEDHVPVGGVRGARLSVRFRATEERTKRGTFIRDLAFSCRSMITTDEVTYEGHLEKGETQSRTSTESAWFVKGPGSRR